MWAPLATLRLFARHPLAARDKLSAARRYLSWQLATRILPGEYILPFANGARLVVRRSLTGATGNVYFGLHEFEEMAFVCHFLRPGDLFVDIGANVGTYTVLGAAVGGADAYAYEPVPATLKHLEANVAVNGLGERVKIRRVALGGSAGVIRVTQDEGATNHVAAASDSTEATTEVPVVRLDDDLGGRVPTLIKMDVEGFEEEVLGGASRVLADRNLRAIIVEINGQGQRYGSSDEAVRQHLRAAGFERMSYDAFDRALVAARPLADPRRVSDNELYVRDAAFVQERVRSAPPVNVVGMTF
jgi:FkbM family methyltransferase